MITADLNEYFPATFLSRLSNARDAPAVAALVILNQPLADFRTFARLWRNTQYHICADGGANRLFDIFKGELVAQRENYLPNSIHGDLDSLRHDVRAYYDMHAVQITQDGDQYSTDFEKSLHKISREAFASSLEDVLILGSLGGRVDQGLGLLHEMIREQAKYPHLRLWLFSESSVSFILRTRHSSIRGLKESQEFTQNVGLIPIYGPSIITTTGLEWDVKDWTTQMGRRVSTSNHVKMDEVEVEITVPILFTVETRPVDEMDGGQERWGIWSWPAVAKR